ncbi:hypothetical protein Abr02nite_75910 [Paractinoplanes brasiliensis]|nr:hypothetical protein Abr02nite_75910 [Actinoplanes brasiliensis]
MPGTIARVAMAYTRPTPAISQSRAAAKATVGGRPAGEGGGTVAAGGGWTAGYDIDDSPR